MTVAEELRRIIMLKNRIVTKLCGMKIAQEGDNLSECTEKLEGVNTVTEADVEITGLADTYLAPGYYPDGIGIGLAESEKSVVTAENIRSGISILGVAGTYEASSGSVPDPSKAVRFYDYDGTLLYSYSHDEMISLTELPALPSHDGLTAQGWNWTLEEILGGTADINVGVMYTTSDEATRLHINLQDNLRSTIPLYFYQTVSGGATIDWGDGSSGETVSGTGYVETSHTYSAPGKYTISITPGRSCNIRLGKGASGSFVFGECNVNTRVIASYLEEVNIGARCSTLNSYTFQYCRNLRYITIPTSVTATGSYTFNYCDNLHSVTIPQRITSVGIYAFGYCRSLKTVSLPLKLTSIGSSGFRYCYGLDNVTIPYNLATVSGYCFSECHAIGKVYIPDSVTAIGNYAFNKCSSLAELTLPDALESIGSYAFYQNYSLREVNMPESVTSIGTYAFYDCHSLKKMSVPAGVSAVNSATFYNCYGMKEYYLYPTSPPSLQSSSFNNIPDDCVIYVPQGSYDAYIADSAWQSYGEHIAEMDQ